MYFCKNDFNLLVMFGLFTKAAFFISMLALNIQFIYAQPLDSVTLATKPIYTSLEEALKNPEQVYRLNLRKQKLTSIPIEIGRFTNLQELDISKNKINELPSYIENLPNLQYLDASNNYLTTLPSEIGKCLSLKKLILNRNYIETLPPSMGYLIHLEYLDMWSNSIIEFPESMSLLAETLKELDLRVINMNEERQEAIKALLPKTKIHFSRTCNCN